jgi:hypothetical protein
MTTVLPSGDADVVSKSQFAALTNVSRASCAHHVKRGITLAT